MIIIMIMIMIMIKRILTGIFNKKLYVNRSYFHYYRGSAYGKHAIWLYFWQKKPKGYLSLDKKKLALSFFIS